MKNPNCSTTMETLQPIRLSELSDILSRIPTTFLVIIVSVFAVLIMWQQRAEMRFRLKHLDAALLDDVGLSREQIEVEAEKPFWEK